MKQFRLPWILKVLSVARLQLQAFVLKLRKLKSSTRTGCRCLDMKLRSSGSRVSSPSEPDKCDPAVVLARIVLCWCISSRYVCTNRCIEYGTSVVSTQPTFCA